MCYSLSITGMFFLLKLCSKGIVRILFRMIFIMQKHFRRRGSDACIVIILGDGETMLVL